jgi:benzil reductase ((S)-benzoin forming)
MQEHIREADAECFSTVEKFRDYKANNELATPEEVAQKVIHFMHHTDNYNDVLVDVRNM